MKKKITDDYLKSLVGIKIGELTIKEYIGRREQDYKPQFKCECSCGETVIKNYNYLFYNGNKKVQLSCGCKASEWTREFNKNTKSSFNNKYKKIKNDYYEIYIDENNDVVIVDEKGLKLLKQLNRTLQIDCRGYPFITKPNDRKQYFLMNIIMLGFDYSGNKQLVDHINNNRKDNRECNLRLANSFQNTQNAKIRKDNSVGVKGFYLIKPKNRPTWKIACSIQYYLKRITCEVPLSREGFKYLLLWDIHYRLNNHEEFSNFGFEIKNKTYRRVIEEQFNIFINNLNNEELRVFNNDGYYKNPLKKKECIKIKELKTKFENLNLDEIILVG